MTVPGGRDEPRLQAFVLAAGRGERLRPITDHLPKPLLPVLGRPVIHRVVERILELPVGRVGVNAHHLSERIVAWALAAPFSDRITIFDEPQLMGTGGGIRNALISLCAGGEDLLVHNGDILSDIDLPALAQAHRDGGGLVTLAVHDHPPHNNLKTNPDGELTGIDTSPDADAIAFTGIAVYEPGFLRYLDDGPSHVVDAWMRATDAGEKIRTFRTDGARWTDIGRPEAYAAEVFRRLDEQGRRVFVAPRAPACSSADFRGRLVIEGEVDLPKHVRFADTILLEGADVAEDSIVENRILGPGFDLDFAPPEMEPRECTEIRERLLGWDGFREWSGNAEEEPSVERTGSGGSTRRFYRISQGDRTIIGCLTKPGDVENDRYENISRLFLSHGVRAAFVMGSDTEGGRLLMEDLGDRSLYDWLHCRPGKDEIAEVYRRVMVLLAHIHSIPVPAAPSPPSDRYFDAEHFLWESGYFLEQYFGRFHPEEWGAACDPRITEERQNLAQAAGSGPDSIVHRDFQSQNVMIVGNEREPAVVDLQGARVGPAAYDVASILWDPYARLHDDLRRELLAWYLTKRGETQSGFDANAFNSVLIPCRIQRHLQALGAYGFLSRVRSFTWFEQFVPEGLRLLAEDFDAAEGRWPVLEGLVVTRF